MVKPEVFQRALVLTGPTGCGKTRAALSLAKCMDAEIVSVDSMAIYRGMDIGTAKPSVEERLEVPHHLIDVLDPWESASVAWWLEEAALLCDDIQNRGKKVLFVGGTALYLKAMISGLFDGPPASAELRERLEAEAAAEGRESLHLRLHQIDPESANKLHPNDLRRVVRALEVFELTGKPLSAWQQEWNVERKWGPRCVWIDLPRTELYERIDLRVEQMFQAGLVDEVVRLLELPQPLSREARQALGYKEVIEYLQGVMTLEETVTTIQTRTRQFAKRQVTWFRHLPGCHPVDGELTSSIWDNTMK
ncbi:MAG: tRNA (adenosine(37)-N6)-dimethylallyltransferase MiaA [Gemmataceae bacterium]